MFNKIAIIGGSGNVGSHIAFLGAMRSVAKEIVLYSIDVSRCFGIGLDVSQAACVFNLPTRIRGVKSYNELADSEVVIIASGFPRKPNMSREELLVKNAEITKEVVENIAKIAPKSVLLLVSNPLDVMCYGAKCWSGFGKERVIGMAGELDSARLAYAAREAFDKPIDSMNALVIGSHNDDMLPLLSHSNINHKPMNEVFSQREQEHIIAETKNGGAKIVSFYKKGSAYFAPAAGAVKMLEAMLGKSGEILIGSVYMSGEYGLEDVFLGLPIRLHRNGLAEIVELELSEKERQGLKMCADNIKKQVEILKNNALLNNTI